MHPLIQPVSCVKSPECLAHECRGEPGLVLLHSSLRESPHGRYSFVAARPFLQFRSHGPQCELVSSRGRQVQFGNPWRILAARLSRYELLEERDLPFPLGGCFGFWGYDLKRFTEPKLNCRAADALELPDCQVGFYDSLVAFDHWLGQTWVISTGLREDGSRSTELAQAKAQWWSERLAQSSRDEPGGFEADWTRPSATGSAPGALETKTSRASPITSNLTRAEFIQRVERARAYIRAGDLYQVNLSHRLSSSLGLSSWELFQRLIGISPAPFSSFLDCGDFQLVSSSPELFLRMSGSQVRTRPIKGTRARSFDPTRDAQLAYELQTSAKETAELVMITDLLRNDLGRCCEFGSVQTPDLLQLERFPQVQHLVSTVEGRLRVGISHLDVLASSFPGGSVTGAPKFRAMEIIDELEPDSRGPYTGALGYLGFNGESQLSIIIRAAICRAGAIHFPVGAGIVADSDPGAEFEETILKARGLIEALQLEHRETPATPAVKPAG
ncbi:MAG TPA: anthranilate synthase component I family protein [Verrucomicrobiae bacterium]|nr:anthranilate synthase component I family protein [Verrucomicrobiae bacterium]